MATKTFTLTIILEEGNKEIVFDQMSSLAFDKLFGFQDLIDWNVNQVKKLTEFMIKPNFLEEFYEILDSHRLYSAFYKSDLLGALLNAHFEDFSVYERAEEPFLVLVTHEFHNGVAQRLPFIKDESLDFSQVKQRVEKHYELN